MKLLVVLAALFLCSCVSTRLVLEPTQFQAEKRADFTEHYDLYFWGLSGHPELRLQKVCGAQRALAVEYLRGIEDGILTGLTAGIYAPMTAKVWCGD